MTGLDELLGEEYRSPAAKLYLELAREDQNLLAKLIEARKANSLSQDDIAKAMGVTQATVSAFERLGNDPKLSTIRRYAKAVGAMIRHQVDVNPVASGDSHDLVHMGSDGMLVTETASARARRARNFSGSVRPWPEKAVQAADDAVEEARSSQRLAEA